LFRKPDKVLYSEVFLQDYRKWTAQHFSGQIYIHSNSQLSKKNFCESQVSLLISWWARNVLKIGVTTSTETGLSTLISIPFALGFFINYFITILFQQHTIWHNRIKMDRLLLIDHQCSRNCTYSETFMRIC
jgi:uncharacterized membrane protein YciS (DUF1049 family)